MDLKILRTILFAPLYCVSTVLVAQQSYELTDWQVSIDGGKDFQPIRVPGTVEDQIDLTFDGVSIYETQLPRIDLQLHQQARLRFAAVATHARVLIGDQIVAEHLGGWTPFEVDATEFVRRSPDRNTSTQIDVPKLRLIVDERVGHNTQGFLPIVTKHFGGIWQSVTLAVVGSSAIDKDSVCIQPDSKSNSLTLNVPIRSSQEGQHDWSVQVAQLDDQQKPLSWHEVPFLFEKNTDQESASIKSETQPQISQYRGTAKIPFAWHLWSPELPTLYQLKIAVTDRATGQTDVAEFRFGVRNFEAQGNAFVLNGQPYSIRGVLNWGYAPPSVAPSLDESWMRREIEFAQARGFNLMKFCLWIPPKRYLELCDELGILAWVEYPTWHPKLDQAHFQELSREYKEFFCHDRNHASVVLRSLTCETGPSADLATIKHLYDLCKSMIPGAVVEDDSSWISWNRIHDFYDDHPYGNNHNWVETLARLNTYISERETKPLALGEAIAADSWTLPTDEVVEHSVANPAHGVWFAAANRDWISRIGTLAKSRRRVFQPELMTPQSIHYGMLMRKFQIETYHREVPTGAYVVSVIRDFPKAAMGLIDFQGQPKNSPQDWAFHGHAMILLKTADDRRSFVAGQSETLHLIAKDLSATHADSTLELTLLDPVGIACWSSALPVLTNDGQASLPVELTMPIVSKPTRFRIHADWQSDGTLAMNEWPIWVFPGIENRLGLNVHLSASEFVREHFDDMQLKSEPQARIIFARKLDGQILEALQQGAKVFLIPDGSSGSFGIHDQWFLRGSVAVLTGANETWHSPFTKVCESDSTELSSILELQHFDLAGPVVSNIDHFQNLIDPLVVLWDNHDQRETKTHGLAFRMEFGQEGVLLVSTLNHSGNTNAAGRWLLHEWLGQLASETKSELRIDAATREQTLGLLRLELNRRLIELHHEPWQFQPDPEEVGKSEGWFRPEFNDSQWSTTRIDRHWEGQGYADLDRWAWYRRAIEIPTDWNSPTTFLNMNGVDDYADIYVNGVHVASVGNIEKRETAFEARKSIDISEQVKAGETIQISVAVYDWYGAGGIFRPMSLSVHPLSENPPILK